MTEDPALNNDDDEDDDDEDDEVDEMDDPKAPPLALSFALIFPVPLALPIPSSLALPLALALALPLFASCLPARSPVCPERDALEREDAVDERVGADDVVADKVSEARWAPTTAVLARSDRFPAFRRSLLFLLLPPSLPALEPAPLPPRRPPREENRLRSLLDLERDEGRPDWDDRGDDDELDTEVARDCLFPPARRGAILGPSHAKNMGRPPPCFNFRWSPQQACADALTQPAHGNREGESVVTDLTF